MKAVAGETLLAEAPANEIVVIEGHHYFPQASLTIGVLRPSPKPYTCPWKGRAEYFDVTTPSRTLSDAAWTYPSPKHSAIEHVGHDFTGYIAFDPHQVTVS
ncbi:DUF427 domain-containing protein [Kribbella jiaozuonensis]|uniref:DUF427 domain-containing protein n=1 Tax=Kribbella jiaozuonensis TaxID=2575441 RepID=A0A4U3M3Q0_9ACTN|nr:DUF427 domain-containing protein [Kribbella jiaozuonensis]TKK83398.1 DUF427 domain-containing protein [Kribbella jiaozuonensis]